MFLTPAITTAHGDAANAFQTFRHGARRDALLSRLVGGPSRLSSFYERPGAGADVKRFLGLRDVPVGRIVGSLDRGSDFDGRFRPLKKHLRDRWIRVFALLETDAWPPIIVHKVEDSYYVEDGHHRVSVANYVGMAYIQAEVWEHAPAPIAVEFPRPAMAIMSCRTEDCLMQH